MSFTTFITDKEFEQAAINLVARLVCDYASEYISGGTAADIGEQTLDYLKQVASSNDLSCHVVNTYYEMIADANQEIYQLDDEYPF